MGKIVLKLTRKLVDPGPVNWEEWEDALDEVKRGRGRPKLLTDEERKIRRKANYDNWVANNRERMNQHVKNYQAKHRYDALPENEALHRIQQKIKRLNEAMGHIISK
jgi:hypothetical protein